jgi:hypothetical protein
MFTVGGQQLATITCLTDVVTPLKIGRLSFEAKIQHDGCLALSRVMVKGVREARAQARATLDAELTRRRKDLDILKSRIQVLLHSVEKVSGQDAEDVGQALAQMLGAKGVHDQQIAELEATDLEVVHAKVRVSSVLAPGRLVKLSWFPEPVVWCLDVDEREEVEQNVTTRYPVMAIDDEGEEAVDTLAYNLPAGLSKDLAEKKSGNGSEITELKTALTAENAQRLSALKEIEALLAKERAQRMAEMFKMTNLFAAERAERLALEKRMVFLEKSLREREQCVRDQRQADEALVHAFARLEQKGFAAEAEAMSVQNGLSPQSRMSP